MKRVEPPVHPAKPQESVRGANRAALLKLALDHPDIDRTLMAEMTNLTTPAVTRISQELIAAGLLVETGALDGGGRGRKRQGLRLNPNGGYVLGVSVLAFNTGVTLCNLAGKVVARELVFPSDLSNPTTTLDEIAAAAHRVVKRNVSDRRRVIGAGAAISGFLDASGEIWAHSPYLGWPEFNIRQSLEQRLGLPVAIENVNRAIVVAETGIGNSRGSENVFLIRAALGLGGAMISLGEVSRGRQNKAGQIGHIPAHVGGKRCGCGKIGCLNTVASGMAVLERLGLSADAGNELEDVQRRADQLRDVLSNADGGHGEILRALTEAGTALGTFSAAPILVHDPDTVILTGPLGRNPAYCAAFREQIRAAGVTARIVTGDEHEILQPAEAAAGLALSEHFFSASLDIEPLIEAVRTGAGGPASKEGMAVL